MRQVLLIEDDRDIAEAISYQLDKAGLQVKVARTGEEGLEAGMYLVGCVYNFCSVHCSLRVRQEEGKKWLQRTPAMAAGWTNHVWSIRELLSFRVLHG